MTDLNSFNIPPLKNWQDFERLCRKLMSDVYGRNFQLWGRHGQRQNGVDAYLNSDGNFIALQCKGRSGGFGKSLSISDVDNALLEIEKFPHIINQLIILTTADDDVAIQNYVEYLNNGNLKKANLKLSVLGWSSITNLIAERPKIQEQFFRHFFYSKFPLKIMLIFLIFGIVIGLFILYEKESNQSWENNKVIVNNLHEIIKELDFQKENIERCESFLEKNIYSYSSNIFKECISPQSSTINQMEKLFESITHSLSEEAFSEIHYFRKIMEMDLRDGYVTIQMAKSFEDKAIQNFIELCHPKENRELNLFNSSIKDSLIESLNNQLSYYFILRDFSLPAITSMKSRILIHQRKVDNKKLPIELIKEANKLNSIIEKRLNYRYLPQSQPFMLSRTKELYTRDIKIQNNVEENLIEDALLEKTLIEAPIKSLVGRPQDIEHLISCGVFKPEARKLVDQDYMNY